MLRSVDLFTGIGGFALALRDIAVPVVYCDRDPDVIAALERMTSDGRLPKAAIVSDVRNLDEIVKASGGKADIVTAGFPCVGFSAAGDKEGLENPQSALFSAAMKVVRALKPGFVFLENVPGLLTIHGGEDFSHVVTSLRRSGYHDVRWTIVSAQDVGAPQLRRRWFCIAVRNGFKPRPLRLRPYEQGAWTAHPKPANKRVPGHIDRFRMLGNAIVPFAARTALARLFGGFDARYAMLDPKVTTVVPFTAVTPVPGKVAEGHGAVVRGKRVAAAEPEIDLRDWNLVLDPKHYVTSVKPGVQSTAERIKGDYVTPLWPTPRYSCPSNSNVLTVRNRRDLANAALFAKSIAGKTFPKNKIGDKVDPRFVEWLMGYPKDHTR